MIKKLLLISLLVIFVSQAIVAQELNATVKINSSKVEGNRQLLQSLEEQLYTFINERNWTDLKFEHNERIDCSFTIVINQVVNPTSFKAELHVQSRRPVYNTSYNTQMISHIDDNFSFDYIEHQQLSFDLNRYESNLTSVIAYYVYLILGTDFDSMSPMGGSPYYQSMYTVATNAQSFNQNEWGSFAGVRSRSSIAAALNNHTYDEYRNMWYQYHRKGLDEMTLNIDAGRKNIVTSLSVLNLIKTNQPNSIVLSLFSDAKLDEIIDVYSNGDANEKQSALLLLERLYPSKGRQLERLRQ